MAGGRNGSRRGIAVRERPEIESQPRVTALIDRGSPPLLGYALACSIAWHTRRPTLLVAAGEEPARELAILRDRLRALAPGKPRAYLRLVSGTSTDLRAVGEDDQYSHVLVQVPAGTPVTGAERTLGLGGPSGTAEQGVDYTIRSPLPGTLNRPTRDGELQVPAAQREDESALIRGVLSPETPMGRALGWAARDIAGLKVGLALGAGSALGYAHIGVLQALHQAAVPIDFIAGASVGSCIAALYSAGYSHDTMAEVLDEVGASAWRLTLPRAGLLSVKSLRQHLRQLSGDRRIEDLPVPLAIVAADIASRREIVFRRGPVWPALLASAAIPGIFPPQRIGSFLLVDGGVVNPVPGDVVASMGADVVIAVKLLARPHSSRIDAAAEEPSGPSPTVFHTVMRAVEMMQSRITAAAAEAATVQIAVDFSREEDPGLRHFRQGRRFIPLGEVAVESSRPRLSAVLPWVEPDGHSETVS